MASHAPPCFSGGSSLLRTCVSPDGRFRVGRHQPAFEVVNLRKNDFISRLGQLPDGTPVWNHANFPETDIQEPTADIIYEIPNPLPCRGTTFINSAWADPKARHPEKIRISKPSPCSLFDSLETFQPKMTDKDKIRLLTALPHPVKRALAQVSTDPAELRVLANHACTLMFDQDTGDPWGMGFRTDTQGQPVPDIPFPDLFEILVNNPHLPDTYKTAMVLRPGIQGNSEIVGDYMEGHTHVFEYLRRNSYIPWGHFAANMAHDQIRYRARDLTIQDIQGLRHLYYQRVYCRVAAQLDIPLPKHQTSLSVKNLETLRQTLTKELDQGSGSALAFNGALWGWNFGFGSAASGHRLHASHQMIHQQNALIPRQMKDDKGVPMPCFACGDLVSDFIQIFEATHDKPFFDAYVDAMKNNRRTDGNTREDATLIIHEDDHVRLFVPKAQVNEWELQVMTRSRVPHVLAADTKVRDALDLAILKAVQTLEKLGAQMVTGIELSARFDASSLNQHMIYSFIPRLPYAPPTFSEAQLRWISGVYPEDLARACRKMLN
ncbi:MAG: hypothetical protein RQ739_01295 [Desulfotignum sp.]|nr:hypothetical protein [Desulfotignum sp.]